MRGDVRRSAWIALLAAACGNTPPDEATEIPSAPEAGAVDGAVSPAPPALDASTPPLPDNDGVAIVGNARFTVITPTLIRLEYDPARQFVDDASYFAAERTARFRHAHIDVTAAKVTIDTGALSLTYTDDGKPFDTTNLTATVTIAGSPVSFEPAAPSTDNLGGTTRTLDNWDGAAKLDDGILSRAGHYVLDDSTGTLTSGGWAKERKSTELDWYLFGYGHDYRAALSSLTAIGGAVPMPRKYALGAWYSRYWPHTSADFEAIVQEYADHEFPLDVVVLDMDWHRAGWTGWSWNRDLIPDPAALMTFLHGRGLASTVNVHPADGVAPAEDEYAHFMTALGQDPASGKTIPFDAANRPYMDALFKTVHVPLEAVGVDFFWLDWQQDEFTRGLPHLGNIPWLNELYFRHTSETERRGISFSRWGGFGDHRHPIHFSGDAATSFEMLAFEVPFTATSGNSGLFFWTHDIGGHHNGRNEESYTRWCQFGALSAALRPHSTRDATLDRRPWTYPDWALHSMQSSWQLRARLFPYLYSSVWQSTRDSVPFLRPMYLASPEAEDAYHQPQQYMLGDTLLVAPVAEAGAGGARLGRQAVWFPAGTFYDFATGERYDGPGEHLVARTIDEIPLFVRAGAPLPMQAFVQRMATTQTAEVVVRCYPGDDGVTTASELHEDDGISNGYAKGEYATTRLACARKGNATTVTIDPAAGSFDGQLGSRSYVVEVPVTGPAAAARVDGAPAKSTYDAAARINRVRVDARSIQAGVTVQVDAPLADVTAVRRDAIAARTGRSETALAQIVANAFGNATTDAERLAILAAAGGGVYPKNQNVYGFPNVPTLIAYREPWLDVPSAVSTSWDAVALMQHATVTFGGRTITLTGAPLQYDFTHPGKNLAKTATATFSSIEQAGTTGINDEIVGGYPGARAEEWSSKAEKAGAWARFAWTSPQAVSEVVLYDRINANDQVEAATITFGDGATVSVGALSNDPSGGPTVVKFPSKLTTTVTVTITAVSATTENVGLAEVAVYGP